MIATETQRKTEHSVPISASVACLMYLQGGVNIFDGLHI